MKNNVILDLETGKRCYSPFVIPENIIYDREAGCPRWEQFIDEVTCGDKQLANYLQRMVGYWLTDDTREQLMFFLVGNGCNGKSVFVDTIASMLGDYAAHCHPSTVLGDRRSRLPSSDLARLEGVRLAVTREPDENHPFEEMHIKTITDHQSKVCARKIYEASFEFTITFKVVMTTNYIPKLGETRETKRVWGRIQIVPFNAQFDGDKKDTSLSEKLRRELPGIFNWAVAGAVDWYAHGLPKLEVDHDQS